MIKFYIAIDKINYGGDGRLCVLSDENGAARSKMQSRLTTVHESNEAEEEESQPQNKRDVILV